ncbi:uncharacterized protein BJ212DRAFT_1265262 [Suillus subaureus]|uniref:Uncharacterized protein n=1 Tax=Suillus subaureus TaxID=48587 RepID=A0A9P7EIX4_9AGAM|nr:uncharacterized protein BJ212DRAFT_1265262 [Suillus subaureus]KAG1821945.1 hypothetical protein BJ212DRAFT_1265262 [Suillus subaureus]
MFTVCLYVFIGVWKMLFVHLLCIISAHDKGLLHTLDQRYGPSSCVAHLMLTASTRYRQTLTFGSATI